MLWWAVTAAELKKSRRWQIPCEKNAPEENPSLLHPTFPKIQAMEGFDWKNQEPEQIRAFKPKYHLTMGTQTLNLSELYLMDKNYADRIVYRKRIILDHHDIVIGVSNVQRVSPALRELYTWLLGIYLPKRYPTMFKVHQEGGLGADTRHDTFYENLVTGERFPSLKTQDLDPVRILENIGHTIDEDLFFLMEEENSSDPKYVLEGYVCVNPGGFNPASKLGKRLADIHGPVPNYGEKMEMSMDRFFKRLEVGQYVKRHNWTINTNEELFQSGIGENHAHEGDKVEELKSIDVGKTFLRSERQTLHRLPSSRAIVFGFKTYLYSVRQIKEEGLGVQLAEAIEGIHAGSVPKMYFYKRGPAWGPAVKRYLRS
ncbi:hypothetical protein DL95DRAFT_316654 [Leptodontidium sp. 2 PMI_412]|nr:hypothetical protein DL95DRAFT_316654 [Leptodontidium sp. 2 PMI_412]